MKKILIGIIMLIVLVGVVACGGNHITPDKLPEASTKTAIEGNIESMLGVKVSLPTASTYTGKTVTEDGITYYQVDITDSEDSASEYFESLKAQLSNWTFNDGVATKEEGKNISIIGINATTENNFSLLVYYGPPVEMPDTTVQPQSFLVIEETGEGYACIITNHSNNINKGDSFSFTVRIYEDYYAGNMVVKANGNVLTATDGTYTVNDVQSNVILTVEGVVLLRDINFSIDGNNFTYDGTVKSPTVSVEPSSATVYYSTDEGENKTWSTTLPSFTTPGEYPIYIKASAIGYKDYVYNEGEAFVLHLYSALIDDAEIIIDDVYATYDGNNHAPSVTIPEGATIKYSLNYDEECTLTSMPEFINAGEYTLYYEVTKENHYPKGGGVRIDIGYLSLEGISHENFLGYEGATTGSITVIGIVNGDIVEYKVNDGEWSQTNPVLNAADGKDQAVKYRVIRANSKAEGTGHVLFSPNEAFSGITVSDYLYPYRGETIPLQLEGVEEQDQIFYRLNETDDWSSQALGGINVGTYTILYKVVRPGSGIVTGSGTLKIGKGYYNGPDVEALLKGIDFNHIDMTECATLQDITLPEGFEWKYPNTPITDSASNEQCIYNGDPDNYNDYTYTIQVRGQKYYFITVELTGCSLNVTSDATLMEDGRYKVSYLDDFIFTVTPDDANMLVYVEHKEGTYPYSQYQHENGVYTISIIMNNHDIRATACLTSTVTSRGDSNINDFDFKEATNLVGKSWGNTTIYFTSGATIKYYAGARSGYLPKVFYSVDNGATWQEATLNIENNQRVFTITNVTTNILIKVESVPST